MSFCLFFVKLAHLSFFSWVLCKSIDYHAHQNTSNYEWVLDIVPLQRSPDSVCRKLKDQYERPYALIRLKHSQFIDNDG